MSEPHAVITGASQGIGAAVARDLAAEGAAVVLGARSIDAVDQVAEEIRSEDGIVETRQVDVRDPSSVEALMTAATDSFGEIDVVVANAGIYRGHSGHTPLPEETYSDYDDHMATNARGVFATIREAVPSLASEARILVPSGKPAREPTPGTGAYAVSKAAAEAIARGFSADLEQAVGIVDPGQVITDLSEKETGREPEAVAPLFTWAALEAPAETVDGQVVGIREWRQATR